ncbi:hypothetical protein BJ508DRAFT_176761 [Ascobolus immersus RN42]|uniref:DNA helicase n=1 Tax=Ascobolus immersus RN42 TaxID=1160509 RepID=A0A3N4IMQ1_ASCIM|nr:hypothetical protein BJ508DRAFT_176761 [Ascobolus immersus RN42]
MTENPNGNGVESVDKDVEKSEELTMVVSEETGDEQQPKPAPEPSTATTIATSSSTLPHPNSETATLTADPPTSPTTNGTRSSPKPNLTIDTTNHHALFSDSDSSLSSLSPVPEDTAIDIIKPPPCKKRKVGDSPPWKSAMTQTPTSIIVDGKRRSGRVNLTQNLLAPQSPTPERTISRPPASKATPKSKPHPSSPTRKGTGSSQKGKSGTNGIQKTQGRSNGISSDTVPESRNRRLSSSTKHSKTTPSRPRPDSSRRNTRRKSTTVETETSPEQEEEMVYESESDSAAVLKGPRIKLVFKPPPPLVTNPNHVIPPKKYNNFAEAVDAPDEPENPESIVDIEEEIRKEAELLDRIEAAIKSGLLDPTKRIENIPEKQPEPPRPLGHWDTVISAAIARQKLLRKDHRQHLINARRCAVGCALKVQELRPKTKEELEEEEEWENRRLYKEAMAGLKKKWAAITQEVEQRKIQQKIEEERLEGEKNLKRMLEQSTELLRARRRGASEEKASDNETDVDMSAEETANSNEEDEEGDGDDEEAVEGEDEDEDADEDLAMSSSDEDDDPGPVDDDEDAKLSPEELRAKYAKLLEDSKTESKVEEDKSEAEHDQLPVEDDENFESLLDSDESVTMDSELDDEDNDDEEEDSSEEESDGGGGWGLAGFYSDFAPKKKADSESVVEAEDEDEEYGGDAMEIDAEEPDEKETSEEHLDVQTDEQPAVEETPAQEVAEDIHPEPESTGENHEVVLPATEGSRIQELPDELERMEEDVKEEESMDVTEDNQVSTEVVEQKPEIKTPVPFLLRGTLREYQHYGLDWLAGLYDNKTNGILADEMGLGKTIQTIALLAHLACEKEIWGPHLVVVPTSVILNWEMEFKKWAPGFKILTYYGSKEQRNEKRKGWHDNNLWHVCITSYQIVIQDAVTFKRRNWHYLILDEAHNIKNFRSQRWQTLLNFHAEARLLITGTPLQNNLVELWSLLYFLMPSGVSSSMPTGFANLKEFQEWFAHPVDQLIEGGRDRMDDETRNTVHKLHQVLRPYLLRRLKADVEKQMPAKYEHIVMCKLSKRQRFLYDEFMSLARTKETLASGNYLSIINCLMQLRKVCNHPDLFETRQIVTSFARNKSVIADFEVKDLLIRRKLLRKEETEEVDLKVLNLLPVANESISVYEAIETSRLDDTKALQAAYKSLEKDIDYELKLNARSTHQMRLYRHNEKKKERLKSLEHTIYLSGLRNKARPLYGKDLVEVCSRGIQKGPIPEEPSRLRDHSEWYLNFSDNLKNMVLDLDQRHATIQPLIEKFTCVTPAAVSTDMPSLTLPENLTIQLRQKTFYDKTADAFHESRVRLSIAFPDKRLLQYDCGKLQRLDRLLRDLQAGGHRALIFTQMTKVLDILEQFLNIHGHRYLRLDGSTRVEQRQILTDRFNNDPRILVFILSSRSGGLGINLTGADTVIFYDMDWNPAMDKQCQDRCHRIGQTRDVHIYRFVSEHTIESNILKKANQKRMLDDVVIQEGEFTTDYFNKLDIRDMLDDTMVSSPSAIAAPVVVPEEAPSVPLKDVQQLLAAAEDDEDVAAAKMAQKEIVDADGADFAEMSNKATPKPIDATPKTPKSVEPVTPAAHPEEPPTPKPVEETAKSVSFAEPAKEEVEEEEAEEEEDEEDDGFGHVDEYMIRFMTWDLRDAKVIIPTERSRHKKNSKKAKIRY